MGEALDELDEDAVEKSPDTGNCPEGEPAATGEAVEAVAGRRPSGRSRIHEASLPAGSHASPT